MSGFRRSLMKVSKSDKWELIHHWSAEQGPIAKNGYWYDLVRDVADIDPYDLQAVNQEYTQGVDSYGKYLKGNDSVNEGLYGVNSNQHWGYNFKVVMKVRLHNTTDNNNFLFDKSSVQGVQKSGVGLGIDINLQHFNNNAKLGSNNIPPQSSIGLSKSIVDEVITITYEIYANDTYENGGKSGTELTIELSDGEIVGQRTGILFEFCSGLWRNYYTHVPVAG